ncbi:hypothetical protein ABKN59_009934 [Abortiporus biennis]
MFSEYTSHLDFLSFCLLYPLFLNNVIIAGLKSLDSISFLSVDFSLFIRSDAYSTYIIIAITTTTIRFDLQHI